MDDEITSYEGRLAGLVKNLRELSTGSAVDSEIAAEVVAHLTTRNAHLRGALAHGIKTVAIGVTQVFNNESNIRRLLGMDTPLITEVFREFLADALREAPSSFKQLKIPPALLEKIAFTAAREGFSPVLEKHRSTFDALLTELYSRASNHAQDTHQKALAQSVTPELRIKKLSEMRWEIIESTNDLVLPDCVAISIDEKKQVLPLMMAELDESEIIVLPLTSRTLLVGLTETTFADIPGFNEAAVKCSHAYFICASDTPQTRALMKHIGERSVIAVDTAIQDGLRSFMPEERNIKFPGLVPSRTSTTPTSKPIKASFTGNFSDETVKEIAGALSNLLAEAAWTIPLDRIDRITFADDYPAALATLDRGIAGLAPPATRQDQQFSGIAQSPTVMRDGVIRSHIVLRSDIGHALINDQSSYQKWAVSTIANQLALAGCTQIFDEALPGVLLKEIVSSLDSFLQPCTDPGWTGYFACRATVAFGDGLLSTHQQNVLLALEEAFSEIPKSRLSYRRHGDINELLRCVLPKIQFLLEHVGNLLGTADGLEKAPLEGADALEMLLKTRELRAWVADYHRDLIYLWDNRGQWRSYKYFLALNRHAERLLWSFSIIPWLKDDGQCRIDVPIGVDAEELS